MPSQSLAGTGLRSPDPAICNGHALTKCTITLFRRRPLLRPAAATQSAAVKADRAQIAKLEAETKALRLETTELRTKASSMPLLRRACATSPQQVIVRRDICSFTSEAVDAVLARRLLGVQSGRRHVKSLCPGAGVPEQQVRADGGAAGAAGGALPVRPRLQPAQPGRERPRLPAVRAAVPRHPGHPELPARRRRGAGEFVKTFISVFLGTHVSVKSDAGCKVRPSVSLECIEESCIEELQAPPEC